MRVLVQYNIQQNSNWQKQSHPRKTVPSPHCELGFCHLIAHTDTSRIAMGWETRVFPQKASQQQPCFS